MSLVLQSLLQLYSLPQGSSEILKGRKESEESGDKTEWEGDQNTGSRKPRSKKRNDREEDKEGG